MGKKDNIIEYIGSETNEEGVESHKYNYKFSTGNIKLGEDNGETFNNISVHDEIMFMCAEMFKWRIIQYTFKYDLDKPEDFHEYMKKVDPNYSTTLEDLKKNWDKTF